MKYWINYHHLYYFMTIAEMNSISKAAEKLSLGQPTLSAQLKIFEDYLGVQLFDRKHKRLVLTEHGKLALDYARSIFKLGGEMYEALHDRLSPAKINLQVGALDSIPKQIILQLTESALAEYPSVVSLVEGKLEDLLRDLLAHKIDLLITNHLPSGELTRGLFHRVLSKQQLGFYANPKFKSLRKKFPESLNNMPVVIPTYDSQLRYIIEQWFQANQIKMDIIAETQDTALKKLMAVSGLALIPAASHTVRRQVDKGELVEIGLMDNEFEQIFIVSAQRRISNPVAASLMKSFTI